MAGAGVRGRAEAGVQAEAPVTGYRSQAWEENSEKSPWSPGVWRGGTDREQTSG